MYPKYPFNKLITDDSAGNPKLSKAEYLDSGVLPIVDQGQQEIGGYTNNLNLKNKTKLPCILFGDHTKIIKFIDYPFVRGADGTKILKTSETLDTRFAYHFLKSVELPKTGYDRNFKYLQRIEIPLPPLSEQKRIAAILDKADVIRCKRTETITLLNEFQKSLFLDMFGDPVRNEKGWDIRTLSDVTTKITDGTHHSPSIQDKGIPYVTAKHIKESGVKFDDDPWFISENDHREIYKRCNPEIGDILYIKDGATTGIATINDLESEFSMLSSVALIKLNRQLITPEFLKSILNNIRFKKSILENMSGAGITRLTLSKINNINLFVPPIELQQKYKRMHDSLSKTFYKSFKEKQVENSLFQSLTHCAFNGEL